MMLKGSLLQECRAGLKFKKLVNVMYHTNQLRKKFLIQDYFDAETKPLTNLSFYYYKLLASEEQGEIA